MSSQIDSQNIDKTFPVAGQDNNSQGFRDNFDAIQQNFQFAKSEIEDLQTKSLLKSPLGSTGTVVNNLGGSSITNGSHTNFHGTSFSQASVSGTANVDIANGSLQSFTLSNDTIFTFINWPASGNFAKVRLHLLNNTSAISVGNDIVIGKRYTIDTVGTTNFVSMGADPSARFRGTITGNILSVTVISSGTLSAGTVISGTGIDAGTQIIEQQAGGTFGGTGTYVINQPQTVSLTVDMTGMVSGIVFVATTQGSGNGLVKPWVQATLTTEGTGLIVPSADLNLPLELNPSGSDQVIEAWTWTGSTTRKVFIDYIGNLGDEQSNFFNFSVGSLVVGDPTESTDSNTGSVTVAGGVGITKNLNVGGNTVIDGNLTVTGQTTFSVTSPVSILYSSKAAETNQVTFNFNEPQANAPIPGTVWTVFGNGNRNYNGVFTVTAGSTVSITLQYPSDPGESEGVNTRALSPSSVIIEDLGSIQNVEIINPVRGDVLKYDQINEKWSNNVDLVEFLVSIGNNGGVGPGSKVFFLNTIPLSTNTGVQETFLKFEIGKKYRFNLTGAVSESEDNVATVAPLRFSTTPDIAVPETITPYTDNVVIGSNYVEITITPETPSPLYLYGEETTLDTSLLGAALPIQVGDGPVLVVKDYSPKTSQNILVNTSDNTVTIRLPVNSTENPLTPGTFFTITDSGSASTNNIIIDPINPTATINGVIGQRRIVGDYSAVTLVTDGVNWSMVSSTYNGSEDVESNTAISNSTSVSYFSTGPSPETATLPGGVDGQIKTLIMRSYENTMTVTVAAAGWRPDGNQGSIVFDKAGDSCILQFIKPAGENGKWYVVSNNGCRLDGAGPAEMVSAPASASSTGREGQIAFDSSYLYVCIASNTWKSVPFTTAFRGAFNEGTTNLDSLSDVVISGPIAGQVLKWDGVRWTNDSDDVTPPS
jgi:hypothetical protein